MAFEGLKKRLESSKRIQRFAGNIPKEEQMEEALSKKIGEQPNLRLNDAQLREISMLTRKEVEDSKVFEAQAKKIIMNKKLIFVQLEKQLVRLQKEFAGDRLFPSPKREGKFQIELGNLSRELQALHSISTRYALIVKAFTNLVLIEFRKVEAEIKIDERLMYGRWESRA